MDNNSAVVLPVHSDGFDKLNERTAGLRNAVFGPRCVIEVADENVVPVLQTGRHRTRSQVSYLCFQQHMSHKDETDDIYLSYSKQI